MRDDQHFGVAEAHLHALHAVKELIDFAEERLGVARVEGAGDGRGSEGGHG